MTRLSDDPYDPEEEGYNLDYFLAMDDLINSIKEDGTEEEESLLSLYERERLSALETTEQKFVTYLILYQRMRDEEYRRFTPEYRIMKDREFLASVLSLLIDDVLIRDTSFRLEDSIKEFRVVDDLNPYEREKIIISALESYAEREANPAVFAKYVDLARYIKRSDRRTEDLSLILLRITHKYLQAFVKRYEDKNNPEYEIYYYRVTQFLPLFDKFMRAIVPAVVD